MIASRLAKEASPKDLLIEFSLYQLPKAFEQFEKVLRQEGFIVRRAPIVANVINFYTVSERTTQQYEGSKLINLPSAFNFEKRVVYLNEEELEDIGLAIDTSESTLIIREAMDSKFSIDYEIEETLSQSETQSFLCTICASIVNCTYAQDIAFYDQKTDEIAHISEHSVLSNVWMNMVYQIPGLGKEKCRQIVKEFPTYSSILQDSEGPKKLKKLQVTRGVKSSNLGPILANRIYKVMTSIKGHQNIL